MGGELLADVLLNATMPEEAVAREKEVQIAGIKEEEEQLTSVARNILREALIRRPSLRSCAGRVPPKRCEKLTQKDLLAFRDRYVVAKNGVLSVFGNVKAEEVRQLFEQALATMKPGTLALAEAKPSKPIAQNGRSGEPEGEVARRADGRLSRRRDVQPGPLCARVDR